MKRTILAALFATVMLIYCGGCESKDTADTADTSNNTSDTSRQTAQSISKSIAVDSPEEETDQAESVEDVSITLPLSFGERTGTYSGQVNADGLPDGQGTFLSQSSDGLQWSYEGAWKNGHWEGLGTCIWADGQIYQGNYVNDHECGEGRLILADGSYFEGTFSTETPGETMNASGVFYDVDGTIHESEIVDGNINLLDGAEETQTEEEPTTAEQPSATPPAAQTDPASSTDSVSNSAAPSVPEEPVTAEQPSATPPAAQTDPASSTDSVSDSAAPSVPEESVAGTGEKVYITKTGKKYHYDSHCNGGTYIPSTLAEAQAKGLTPCKKCAGGS